jgi:hypothetical protein
MYIGVNHFRIAYGGYWWTVLFKHNNFCSKYNFPFLKRYSFLDRQGIVTLSRIFREDKLTVLIPSVLRYSPNPIDAELYW